MILVTGASGTVGSEVLRLLSHRNAQVRAMTRNPARLDALDVLHPDVVRADFDDPESLRRAVHGVDCVFLATAPGARIAEQDKAMIDAAMAAGVRARSSSCRRSARAPRMAAPDPRTGTARGNTYSPPAA
jgi:uncharacterized protein YbjT (DUF2867 family)